MMICLRASHHFFSNHSIMKFILKILVTCFFLSACQFKINNPKQTLSYSQIEGTPDRIETWKAMKFGMFIHWGVYSIPAGVWKGKQIEKLGEQIMRHARIPVNEYEAIAKQFNPVNFDPDAIVKMAKNAGMKYIILTAKHHDGFAMFETATTNYDIVDFTPYKKDILKQLADACKRHNLKLGVYYSTPDWHFNGDDQEINPVDNKISVFGKVSKANEDYQVNQLKELLSNYGDIVEVFFDMGEPTAAQSKRFKETVLELQPDCLINGRVMNDQGDFITMPDNHLPDVPLDTIAWETPGTFYHTWGYKSWVKGAPLDKQIKNQVKKLSKIASLGGNFLLNIGPKSDGTVVQYEQEVLKGVGEWMTLHAEAIHGTKSTPFKKLDWGYCTQANQKLYFHLFNYPKDKKLVIPGLVSNISNAYILADSTKKSLIFNKVNGDIVVNLGGQINPVLDVLVVEYQDDLVINPIVIKGKEGVVNLNDSQAIKHGKYGKLSYRSIIKDNFRTWDFSVDQTGTYEIMLTYATKYEEKEFLFEIKNQSFKVNLKGNQKKENEKEQLFDGNETKQKKPSFSKFKTVKIGEVQMVNSELNHLVLKSAKDYQFKYSLKEFHAQDRSNRSLGINVKDLVFKLKE